MNSSVTTVTTLTSLETSGQTEIWRICGHVTYPNFPALESAFWFHTIKAKFRG